MFLVWACDLGPPRIRPLAQPEVALIFTTFRLRADGIETERPKGARKTLGIHGYESGADWDPLETMAGHESPP